MSSSYPPLEYSLADVVIKTVSSPLYHFSGRYKGPPTARHGRFHFQYTVSGMGKIEIGSRHPAVYDLPPGAGFIVLTPGPHRHWFPGGKQPWEFIYTSIFIPELKPAFVSMVKPMIGVHQFDRDSPLIRLVEHNTRFMREREWMIDKYMRSALAYQFIMELRRHFDPETQAAEFTPVAAKALRFIEEHLADRITLRDIARRIGFSPQTVIRAFRQQTNATPVQFLISKRIERAKGLLTETDLPIKAIAATTGFSTPRYFCQRFRRHTGYTPGDYRASGLGDPFAGAPQSAAPTIP